MVARLKSAPVRSALRKQARTTRLQRRLAPRSEARLTSAQYRFTLVKFAPSKFAPVRVARPISAPSKLAPARSAPAKLARKRSAPASEAPLRLAFLILHSFRSAPDRSTPSRSKATPGFSSRQSAIDLGPPLTTAKCSWLATRYAPCISVSQNMQPWKRPQSCIPTKLS